MRIDVARCRQVWLEATATAWAHPPVWVHGDVDLGNLLVDDGRLTAVIDFGCCAVGDPACDLTLAWTFSTGPARQVFRKSLHLDVDTWRRARGWVLWKALITLADSTEQSSNTLHVAQLLLEGASATDLY